MMIKIKSFIIGFLMLALIGCATGGANLDDTIQESTIASATYMIVKNNPDAQEAFDVFCGQNDALIVEAFQELWGNYDSAIADPFLKMQVDIIISTFVKELGVDINAPDFDLSIIDNEDLKPFKDAICLGASAARVQQ